MNRERTKLQRRLFFPAIQNGKETCPLFSLGSTCIGRYCGVTFSEPAPYPTQAKRVCRSFLEMYDFSDTVKCVARCLGGQEASTIEFHSCNLRNRERLTDHCYCYAACQFIPHRGRQEVGLKWDGVFTPRFCRAGDHPSLPVRNLGRLRHTVRWIWFLENHSL